jgi:hypothetical protein
MWKKFVGRVAAAMIVASLAGAASAASVTFEYGGGANNATANAAPAAGDAQAVFTLSGSDLVVTLSNLSTAVTGNGAELTAVYWNSDTISGTFSSVALAAGSSVLYDGGSYTSGDHLSGDANVKGKQGTGWYGFGNNIGLDTGQQYALTGTGVTASPTPYLSLLGEASTDPLYSGYNPNNPDGPAGGLVGTGGAGANLDKFAVVKNSLVFTISGMGSTFDLSSINNVQFQYNTSRANNNVVPVPAAAWMGLSSLAGMALIRFRRKLRGN